MINWLRRYRFKNDFGEEHLSALAALLWLAFFGVTLCAALTLYLSFVWLYMPFRYRPLEGRPFGDPVPFSFNGLGWVVVVAVIWKWVRIESERYGAPSLKGMGKNIAIFFAAFILFLVGAWLYMVNKGHQFEDPVPHFFNLLGWLAVAGVIWALSKLVIKLYGGSAKSELDGVLKDIEKMPEVRAQLWDKTGIVIGISRHADYFRRSGVMHDAGREGDLPQNNILRYGGDRHIVTFGPIGSGKNTTAQTPALLDYDGSAFVIDPKGQLAAITTEPRQNAFGHETMILNPFGVLGLPTCGYNPLRFLDPASLSFSSDCRRIAEGIVPMHKGDHWETSALDVVALLIEWTVLYAESEGKSRDLITVRTILNLPDDLRVNKFEKIADTCGAHPSVAEGAARYASDSKEVRDCIQTAVVQLGFLRDPAIVQVLSDKSDLRQISFAELKRKPSTVYLIIPPELLHTHGRFLRLLVMSALGELIKETTKPPKPVLFMLDEFAQLGPMPLVENAASIVREYNIKLWLILQNLPQLKNLYQSKWESFLSSAGVVQFFTPNDLETAEYLSKRSGIVVKKRQSQSESSSGRGRSTVGTSTSDYESPRLTVQDIFGASGDNQELLCPGVEMSISTNRAPYWKLKAVMGWKPADDPYHMTNEKRAQFEETMRSGDTPFHRGQAEPRKL